MEDNWHQQFYRRILLDFHIPEWHDEFLSKFDPEEFADCVAAANARVATVFANTHTGLCNYPTKVGRMHRAWKGRDGLGEMIEACHKRDIHVVVYYCTIYTDWYWDEHPEARIRDADGRGERIVMHSKGKPRRFRTLCPNNEAYRRFVVAQLEEICDGYEFEGMWPGMTFWPSVCYCSSCRERYRREVGGEMPRTIYWQDPVWVGFQRRRQEWLRDFIHLVTSTIKSKKPGATVAHQSGTFARDWQRAGSVEASREMDWLSADLYGNRYFLSFFAKLFLGLSEKLPFELINTWCWPNVFEHTITSSEEELRLNTFGAFANGGAMVFIDAVDPVGTTHRRNYERVAPVYVALKDLEPYAGGQACQDVGIYYSFENNIDIADNGRDVVEAGFAFHMDRPEQRPTSHRSAAMNLATTLSEYHIPFGVVTKKNLSDLSSYQVVVLSEVMLMDPEEGEAFREYVKAGGCILASGRTSLISADGSKHDDFQLSDLLGVSFAGETEEIVTYLRPGPGHKRLFPGFSSSYPITLYDSQVLVQPRSGTVVLARITLPYTDPRGSRYASILTDPPGIDTDNPALVRNHYGEGEAIYSAGIIECWEHSSQRRIQVELIRSLAKRPFYFCCDGPKSVEITMFHQPEYRRYILHFLNSQGQLPNIPVRDLVVELGIADVKPIKIFQASDGKELPDTAEGGTIRVVIPEISDYRMVVLQYKG